MTGVPGGWLVITRRRAARSCAALLAALLAALGLQPPPAAARMPRGEGGRLRWVACYGQFADEVTLASYNLVVLDPAFRGDLARVAAKGAVTCAYLSLGEIRKADESFGRLDPACLLAENPDWPGTWRVDVRQAGWAAFVLHEVLPAIRARGFGGLMLDTLDTPPWLELVDPVAHRGMRDAAIALVRAIRGACPDMPIVVNRGYAILPQLRPMVDAVIAESLLTSPDAKGGFRRNTPSEVDVQLALLAPARDAVPPLAILSLDYWDLADAAGIRAIYGRERALGHHPYVASPALGEVVPEPAA